MHEKLWHVEKQCWQNSGVARLNGQFQSETKESEERIGLSAVGLSAVGLNAVGLSNIACVHIGKQNR
ncbi:MAG: hypothetical protein FWG75_10005 [Cystobacterineae bacterium]|nr:hypothetical protein [Cystobacterineae bacterium]